MTLEIADVTKSFGSHTAVDHLSLTIPKGQIYGVLGANGAGKTTTFRMIIGLMKPTSGKITYDGIQLNERSSERVGYLPEERGLYPKLTVEQQLVYLGRLRGMRKAAVLEEMNQWLDRFGIGHYAKKKVEELSKGNQQKIQFIASVLHRLELVILDEPFSGLDPVNVEMLKKAVLDVKNQGTTLLFSSHRMEHVEELCEHICIMHQGRAVASGGIKEIKSQHPKKYVRIDAPYALDFLEQMEGVEEVDIHPNGTRVRIAQENVAHDIFQCLSDRGFVRKFELEEPTLNDIFIEKVGAVNE
ncbi:ABC transporter ATP-binding protein [Aureibacillus halotolerans]|uniref:ABC-2 type transport system ATP-binding protein n=1 Tax=Aureibacillus halotolerans TaxID=1508390 RepID=A0A4R6TVH6_9BACI|nr:ABC transporter ATP-binding protein [Aureibacillus halotolerans]TDQ37421.1 ABC-2 type transport system ATP-binding protein [Aureibacillus halotolerans]